MCEGHTHSRSRINYTAAAQPDEIRLVARDWHACVRAHARTHTPTLSVDPLKAMPLKARALLVSCTLRILMNAYGGPLSRVMEQLMTAVPLSS